MTGPEAERLVARALAAARRIAGAGATVALSASRTAHTRYARGEITTTGESDDAVLQVEVSLGRRHASASSNQLDPASVERTVESAARLARLAPEDPEHQGPLGPQRYRQVPSLVDPDTGRLDPARRVDAIAASLGAAGEGVELAGFVEERASSWVLGSTAGLRARAQGTVLTHDLTARTPDGTGSGWAGAWAHRGAAVSATALAATAADKARRSQKPRPLAPGAYTVVLEPAAAGELLRFLAWQLGARAAEEGRSYFSRPGGATAVGERLFAPSITMTSDPADKTLPAEAMDDEGLPRAPIRWIAGGALETLACSREWAAKTGKTPTASPGYHHLHGGEAASIDELVRGVKRGILVTRLWYSRWLDRKQLLVTGLTRDGTFLIEDGEIAHPVNNFRFNESAANVLKNVEAMTRETVSSPLARSMRVPAMRVADFTMASVSDAV